MTAAAKVTANGYNIFFFKSLSSPNYRLWVVAKLKSEPCFAHVFLRLAAFRWTAVFSSVFADQVLVTEKTLGFHVFFNTVAEEQSS